MSNYTVSIRTSQYRYSETREGGEEVDHPVNQPGVVLSRELYDHRLDPFEAKNVAEVSSYREALLSLQRRLKAGWRSELPRQQQQPDLLQGEKTMFIQKTEPSSNNWAVIFFPCVIFYFLYFCLRLFAVIRNRRGLCSLRL